MEMGMSCTDVCRTPNCGNENDSDKKLLGNDDEIGYAGWVSSDDEDNDWKIFICFCFILWTNRELLKIFWESWYIYLILKGFRVYSLLFDDLAHLYFFSNLEIGKGIMVSIQYMPLWVMAKPLLRVWILTPYIG